MSTKGNSSPATGETSLKFGPKWIRDLSHGNSIPQSDVPSLPKYKLAQYRYGREEMLGLFAATIEKPDYLKELNSLTVNQCQLPLAMIPISEDEQSIWAKPNNSEPSIRGSNKGLIGPGNGMSRSGGRGGSVDRGRGRGRGGFHSRGYSFEEGEDAPVGGYSRLRPIERSQSANEKDQRWEERDRRFERPFPSRNSGVLDDPLNAGKPEGIRAPSDNWRRAEKDEENDWRSSNSRTDRYGNRGGGGGSWRSHNDRDNSEIDYKDKAQHSKDTKLNGPMKSTSNHPRPRSSTWDDDMGDVPEWSVEEDTAADVGTFDSSGAFLETKGIENEPIRDETFNSSNEESKSKESNPSSKTVPKSREKVSKTKKGTTTSKPPTIQNIPPPLPAGAGLNAAQTVVTVTTSCETEHTNQSVKHSQETFHMPQTETVSKNLRSSSVTSPTLPTVSSVVTNPSLREVQNVMNVLPPMSLNDVVVSNEEDTFAHHKKATENMVAQWTQEDDHRVLSEPVDKSITVLPIHDKDAYKWFYRDPQGQIQGPFASSAMFDWLKGGFFTNDLQIKRGCDERFVQLGDLTQMWNCIPFSAGVEPPPLRATIPISTDLSTPFTQSASLTNHTSLPVQLSQAELLQQQHLLQQLFRQVQIQQTLNQMKQIDSMASLPPPQRQNLLIQQILAQQEQQQIPRSSANTVSESPAVDPAVLSNIQFPLLGVNIPSSMLKNDLSMWNLSQNAGRWPSGQPPVNTSSSGSIWDMESSIPPPMPAPSISAPIEARELEKRMAAEEDEKQRLALETVKRLEEEMKRKEEDTQKALETAKRLEEEIKRKDEEKRNDELIRKQVEEKLKEIQRQKEEEQKELENIQRKKEQEQQRLENILKEERRIEELKREKQRQEEQRIQEEQMKLAEQKRLAELEEQNRKKQEEEERKRQWEEERKKQIEEESRRRHEEALKLEIHRVQEEQRQQELQKKLKEEQERKEAEKMQIEVQRKKEQEELEEMKAEREREFHREMMREEEKKLMEQKIPAWGRQPIEETAVEMSLADIQKLQEQKEKEERDARLKLQQHLQQQQHYIKQVQSVKNGLSWAKRATENFASVKSLVEIQIEEAERMAQQQKVQKTAATTVQATAASGVWGNSSHLNRTSIAPGWNTKNDSFWDDALKSTTPTVPKPTKSNECAFPSLSNSIKPANQSSNKKNVRAKKNEEPVLRLFDENPNDEFTNWCTEALSNFPSSVDVPTFVAFLKEIDSPYDVYDYVRSYLGEGKEAKEFGKQFLERRSKHRNQTKQSPAEENMWGPAPAITPAVNKTSAQTPIDCDAHNGPKSKSKKKKNRMQKVDNSMLGFTVQPNPDRINVGEIDRIE